MMLLALALNLFGMGSLSMAMKRHHRQLWKGEPGRVRVVVLRLAAVLAILLALALCVVTTGAEQGVLLWLCLLMLAALVQGLLLAFRPHLVRYAAALLLLLGTGVALL